MRLPSDGRQRGGALLGLVIGVILGVLISFGVVWYLNKTPLPFTEKVTRPETPSASKEPVALPGKPGDKPAGERKFDFYEILEGKKPPVPAAPSGAAAPGAETAPPASAAKSDTAAGAIYLQVGAFQKKADADALRAKLAMLGFEAGVLHTELPGKGEVHRVRIGPFTSMEELNRTRSELSEQGVETTVVRY